MYESQLFVSDAKYSDTGQFTCNYIVTDAETSLPSSTHAHVYIYVYGRCHTCSQLSAVVVVLCLNSQCCVIVVGMDRCH